MTFLARLAAWVEKTNKSNNCPSYKKTTKKKADAELNPLSGEELQKIIAQTAAAPPALVARMQAMLK